MIFLGSKSQDKLNILMAYFKSQNIKEAVIIQIETNSGVSDQPLSMEATVLGAKNRSRNAYISGASNIAIGLYGCSYKKVKTIAPINDRKASNIISKTNFSNGLYIS